MESVYEVLKMFFWKCFNRDNCRRLIVVRKKLWIKWVLKDVISIVYDYLRFGLVVKFFDIGFFFGYYFIYLIKFGY